MFNSISHRFMAAAPHKQRQIVFGGCALFWISIAAVVFSVYMSK